MSCKDCKKRHVGCHAHCEDYKAECEKRNQMKEKIHKAMNRDREATWVEIRRIENSKKGR